MQPKIVGVLLDYGAKRKIKLDSIPSNLDQFYIVDQQGIGAACNLALNLAFIKNKAEYCIILANDIVEPQDTLEVRLEAFKEPNMGIVTIPTENITGYANQLAGNFMISKEVFNKIGYFTQEWDTAGYGAIDLQYSYRAHLAGFKLKNVSRALHLDNGDTAYGFSKKQVLKQTYPLYHQWRANPILVYDRKGRPVAN